MGSTQNQPSLATNATSGIGCGCGCLGLLLLLAASIGLGGIPLGFYSSAAHTQVTLFGGIGVVFGLLTSLIGFGVFIGSYFIEYYEEQQAVKKWEAAQRGQQG